MHELIRSLRWYPTEELEELEKLKKASPSVRSGQQERLRQRVAQNYDRIQENLLRLLPVSVSEDHCGNAIMRGAFV